MDAPALLSVLDCLADGVAVVNLAHRYVYLNPAAIELLGPLHLEPTPPVSYFQPDEVTAQDPLSMPLVRAIEEQRSSALRVFVKKAIGGPGKHLSVSGAPWLDAKGTFLGAVSVYVDVTSSKQAEDELVRANAFLDNIIEHVPAMIFVKDAKDLRYQRFNREGEALLGLTRAELLGRGDLDFFPREQALSFIARDRETLSKRDLVEIPEEPIDTRRGRRWLSTRKVPVFNRKGEPEYLLGISVDITARKQVEEELQGAHAELEARVKERTAELLRANEELKREVADRKQAEEALRRSEEQLRQSQKLEAIGRLAGGIAHDFNNMLSAMIGYAGLLSLSLPPDSEGQQDVKQIVLAGERAAALIRQLLAFSRKQVLQPLVLDLGKVVTGMTEMLRRLLGERVELQVTTGPECSVLADPTQMEQVVLNLSINARDAMPRGGHLRIAVEHFASPPPDAPVSGGDWVRLTVADDGVGMSPETRSHVFEPFFTTKPRGEGTGLGAATVFGAVKQSGGEVVVQSEEGQGTTFQIYLPHVQDGGGERPHLSEFLRGGKRTATVLLVEDDSMVRAATRRVLVSAGLDVLEAATPGEALAVSERHAGKLDLLLTDVVLPSMNGRELAQRLSKLRPGLKVLFMSGYTAEAFSREELLSPDEPFLAKPFSPDALVRRIDDVLKEERD